jgi:Lon protease-like protein
MIEGREYFRLALEPRRTFRIVRHSLGQELQRDASAQSRVGCLVDIAHASRPQMGRDGIVRYALADHRIAAFTGRVTLMF